jgi:hypothetical protein
MQAGSRVILVGLQSRADLNQCEATLLSWDSAYGRWGVQVEGSGEKMRIKPANMQFADLALAQDVGASIWDAAKDGHHARLSMLLKSVPPGPWGDVADEAAAGSSALSAAAACAHPKCVALLLELTTPSPNLSLANQFGVTAIHRAAEGGSAEVLQMLLDARGCPHTPDSQGQSPLCYAAEEGRTGCARLLLQAGASPSAKYRGATPYQWALNGGHAECAALLAGKADGGDVPLAYNPKHEVPARDYDPMAAVVAARTLEHITEARVAKAHQKRKKKAAPRAPTSSEARASADEPPAACSYASPDISEGISEEPLPSSQPPRSVLKALGTVTRISADDGGLTNDQRNLLRRAPDVVLHLLKYVDGAASLTPTCERVLMGGLGVTLGRRMVALASFPWAPRVMQSWSAADWAWFLALSCHKFSDVLPTVSMAHHYSILTSFKYAPADPSAWSAQLERVFRGVAALPRFSSDPQSLFHNFAMHADLTACLEFSPMNLDANGDAAYTFDTKWPWKRAAQLLSINIADRTATPALEYKFGDARKVLASDGRWFESAHEYILHRCSAGAGEHVVRADVETVATMMGSICSADQEATFRGQSDQEMLNAYLKRSKHQPMSRALKQAYEKYGILLPEAEVAGVIKHCANCHLPQPPGERFQCCPCGLVYYCSKECQVKDWKSHKPAHKQAKESASMDMAAAVDAETSAAHPGSNASFVRTTLQREEQERADGAEMVRRSGLQRMEQLLHSLPPETAQRIRSGGGKSGPLSREELQKMMPPGFSL